MKKYKCWYGLGGGFGGCRDYQIGEFENEDEAMNFAYELASEEYDNYAGLHGLRSMEEIIEEDEVDEETAREIYRDEMESWVDYKVEELSDDYVEEE